MENNKLVESIKHIGVQSFANGSKTVAKGIIEMLDNAMEVNKDAVSVISDLREFCNKVIAISDEDIKKK